MCNLLIKKLLIEHVAKHNTFYIVEAPVAHNIAEFIFPFIYDTFMTYHDYFHFYKSNSPTRIMISVLFCSHHENCRSAT